MGDLPSPSEYVKLVNSSVSQGDIQIDYVEITAPVYEQWPPDSHTRIFIRQREQSGRNGLCAGSADAFHVACLATAA